MRFRGFREVRIKESERIKKEKEEQGFKKIKPESMTLDEAMAFCEQLFSEAKES